MIPTSTNVSVRVEARIPAAADAVAVFIAEKQEPSAAELGVLSQAQRDAVARLRAAGIVRGKANELASDIIELGRGKTQHVYVVGFGPAEKANAESVRQAAGALAKATRRRRLKQVAVVPPMLGETTQAEAIVNGFLLASFRYEEYRGIVGRQKQQDEVGQRQLTIVGPPPKMRPMVQRGQILAEAQNFARTIASRPGNDINPPSLAKVAQDAARELKLTCRVLDDKQMRRLGMGGILAVGSASATPPRMIVLEYKSRAAASKQPLLVVGKSITFDAGGISIKPAEKMGRMVYDKSGGMVVLGLMYALSKLNLPVHVVGILSAAENTLGGTGYRPGDILRMYNGVTVEVTNTDAEGRLVLADAIAWGIDTYKPSAVVDLATLTGAVIIALGKSTAGMLANNDDLVAELQGAADAAGEKIWRLPLGDEHRELMKCDVADIVNSGGREAGVAQGAAFLSYFVPQEKPVPWAHLDIAGTADTEKELPYYAKGPTGWGVRTLVEWLSRQ